MNELPFETDLYSLLNLTSSATESDLKKSHRNLVKTWHPDKNIGNEEEATKRMAEINKAFDILSDETLKKSYDLKRSQYLSGQTPDPRAGVEQPTRGQSGVGPRLFNNATHVNPASRKAAAELYGNLMRQQSERRNRSSTTDQSTSSISSSKSEVDNSKKRSEPKSFQTFVGDIFHKATKPTSNANTNTEGQKVPNKTHSPTVGPGTFLKNAFEDLSGSTPRTENTAAPSALPRTPDQEIKINVTLENLQKPSKAKTTLELMRQSPRKQYPPIFSPKKITITVPVPAGAPNNHRIIVKGMSNAEYKKTSGDLIFIINVLKNDNFIRSVDNPQNLIFEKEINLSAAISGEEFTVKVPLLDGTFQEIPVKNKILKPQTPAFSLKGQGLPVFGDTEGKTGNLLVKFKIKFPNTVDANTKEAAQILNRIVIEEL